jgi:hypothetical protein
MEPNKKGPMVKATAGRRPIRQLIGAEERLGSREENNIAASNPDLGLRSGAAYWIKIPVTFGAPVTHVCIFTATPGNTVQPQCRSVRPYNA